MDKLFLKDMALYDDGGSTVSRDGMYGGGTYFGSFAESFIVLT